MEEIKGRDSVDLLPNPLLYCQLKLKRENVQDLLTASINPFLDSQEIPQRVTRSFLIPYSSVHGVLLLFLFSVKKPDLDTAPIHVSTTEPEVISCCCFFFKPFYVCVGNT